MIQCTHKTKYHISEENTANTQEDKSSKNITHVLNKRIAARKAARKNKGASEVIIVFSAGMYIDHMSILYIFGYLFFSCCCELNILIILVIVKNL